MTHCDRCHQDFTGVWFVSMWNLDTLCSDCKLIEMDHPGYERAADEASRAARQGRLIERAVPPELRRRREE